MRLKIPRLLIFCAGTGGLVVEAGEAKADTEGVEVSADQGARAPQRGSDQTNIERYAIRVTGQAWRREYGYYGEVRGALREYRLDRAPALGVDFAFNPLVVSEQGIAGKVGVTASYARLLKAEATVNEQHLATDSHFWRVGARGGAVVLDTVELGFGVDYGEHSFWIEDTYVPDPVYRYLRPSAYARLMLSRFTLEGSVGSRFLLHTGQLQDPAWFPRVRGVGGDSQVSLSVRVVSPLALVVGGTWTRYPLAINATEYDQNPNGVAAGLIDLYVSVWGGLEAQFH